jgi:predicted  nucleic acid-binding Zn-ribbon protein
MNKRFLTALLTGAIFMASASMFVACKDYDDDIKNLQAQIDKAALKTELESLKSNLESELNAVKASLATVTAELAKKANQADVDAALAKKADKTELEALADKVVKLTERVATIETQIAAINTALDKKADKTELAALEAALTGKLTNLETVMNEKFAEVNGKLAAEETARKEAVAKLEAAIEAAKTNLQLQIDALKEVDEQLKAKDEELAGLISANADAIEALKTRMATAESNIKKIQEETIPALEAAIAENAANIKTNADNIAANTEAITTLQGQMQQAAEDIDALEAEVDVLNVLVVKILNSLVLKPDFYWEGIEGIEVPAAYPYLFAESKGDYSFTYTVTGAAQGDQKIKVTVKNPMGAIGSDGKIYVCEKANVWDGRYYNDSSLIYSDIANLLPRGVNPKYVELSNGAIAKYHVNPGTADLSGATLKFFQNDAEVYTRANNAGIKATPKSINALGEPNTFEGGILTVPFTVDNDALYDYFDNWSYVSNQLEEPDFDVANWLYSFTSLASNGQPLPFIALQATKTDLEEQRVVTSDYAVVVPAVYTIVALADNAPEAMIDGKSTDFDDDDYGYIAENHLYESVGYDGCTDQSGLGAINRMPTHSVVYNGTIDLKPFIETHFDYYSFARYGKSTYDQVMSDELLEALGLHYEFKAIDYTTGNETTSQSAHIEEIEEGVFAPRSVTEDGQTITGKTATQEVIGREPLVRVDLVDADGNIVRYGYIKLRIVAEKADDLEVTINLKDIYMNCGDSAKVTWSQMENLVLAKLNNGAGMKKEDFEKNYYLDVANEAINYMPHIHPATGELEGTLYGPAAANKFWAVRYFKNKGTGKYQVAGDRNEDNLSRLSQYTNKSNWFGRVWYTPHDNSTTGHNWDENTNVLIWNFGTVANSSNMTEEAYLKMREVVNATYDSKGLNQESLSTIVRFINKNNGTSIWVTLVIDVNKIHFAYADINNRVLDHWYDFTKGYQDMTADTIEVYANVPTPAENGRQNLTTSSFVKDLKEYWLQKKIIPTIHDAAHFDKYWSAGQDGQLYTADDDYLGQVTFKFRLPKKGENTVDIDAAGDGTWKVDGISGYEYTLKITQSGNYDQIVATKRGNTAYTTPELICRLNRQTGVIEYMGRNQQTLYSEGVTSQGAGPGPGAGGQGAGYELDPAANKVNGAASDILNLIGMYDAQGNQQKDLYLTGHAKRTFAAYVEIVVSSENCFAPLLGKNYFNVRFLRPINVWPNNAEITDALNATQFVHIADLVNIKDWRTYDVTLNGSFDEGQVPYVFYGITNLYVRRSEIRSDAYLAADTRQILSDPAEIVKLRSINDIPSLTNPETDFRYLSIQRNLNANDQRNFRVDANHRGYTASRASDNMLAYTNNGGVVKEFHIYVPIAVEYNWGALHGVLPEWTQTVWAVITVNPTINNNAPAY